MVDILRERMNGAGEGAGGLSGQEDAEEPAGFLRRSSGEKEGREKDAEGRRNACAVKSC